MYRGLDEAFRFYAEYYETFEETVVKPDRFIDAGDFVVVPNVAYQRGRDGIEFSARDVRLSLIQASQNKIGTLVDRVLLYCYHYNPETGRYGLVIMNTVRLASLATVAVLALFIAISVRRETA